MPTERRLAAIMFTDIVGFTASPATRSFSLPDRISDGVREIDRFPPLRQE